MPAAALIMARTFEGPRARTRSASPYFLTRLHASGGRVSKRRARGGTFDDEESDGGADRHCEKQNGDRRSILADQYACYRQRRDEQPVCDVHPDAAALSCPLQLRGIEA